MGVFKKIFKHGHSRAWFITSVSLVVLLGAINIVFNGPLYEVPANLWGNKRAITAAGENVGLYVQDFEKKEDACANSDAVTVEICEEGMVLLKNENHALPLAEHAKVSVFGKNSVNLVYGGRSKKDTATAVMNGSVTYDASFGSATPAANSQTGVWGGGVECTCWRNSNCCHSGVSSATSPACCQSAMPCVHTSVSGVMPSSASCSSVNGPRCWSAMIT